jgi:hypothetical protein
MMGCNHDDLLDLARGELPPERAAEVEAHTSECAECARELSWLRTERALFRAQTATPPGHVWQAIERRVVIAREEQRARRQRWVQIGSGATLVAAAAGFLLTLWVKDPASKDPAPASSSQRLEKPEPSEESVAANVALDAAEQHYRAAIRGLEQAYDEERDRLDPEQVLQYDEQLQKLRKLLTAEQAAAQDDVWARKRVLRTYSVYMRTMQAMVLEGRK